MTLRPIAIVPALCGAVGLVLTFLCILAGSSPGFMNDYALLTVNTSQFGLPLVLIPPSNSSNLSMISVLENLTAGITSDINELVHVVGRDVVELPDFLSIHVLDVCGGYFEPGSVPNASVPLSAITKNVTGCSKQTTRLSIDPTDLFSKLLKHTKFANSTLSPHFPGSMVDELDTLQLGLRSVAIMYIVTVPFGLIGVILSLVSICGFHTIKWDSGIQLITSLVAGNMFIASIITVIIRAKGSRIVELDSYYFGIEPMQNGKFMALTWTSTMFFIFMSLYWSVEMFRKIWLWRKEMIRSYTALGPGSGDKGVQISKPW